ncbi:MAG: tRNA lysidine(34) synthetase TilS [Acidimicrobiia bacterium]
MIPLGEALATFVPRLTALDEVDGPVLVGCSGGADSLALLALVRAVGYDAIAVYVDHGLRGTSAHDVEVVTAAADRFGAEAYCAAVEVDAGGNLEARAREARYAALMQARDETGAAVIAVGHTRDDQAETVLLNLLRGSGASGLAGMARQRGRLRRPLLDLRRSETREICARLGLAPVHDAMNDDVRFRRVWLRREVVPLLERGAQRDLVEVLARQADVLRDDDALLDALAADAVPPGPDLGVADLTAASAPLARRAVREWLGSPPAALEHVEAVLAVARGDRRAVELPGGHRVERAGGRVHLVPATAAPAPDPAVFAPPGALRFGRFGFVAWVEHAPPVAWPDGRTTAVLDADHLGDTVVVRTPEAGDRFRPLGRGGAKGVLEALGDAGVPAADRATRPVLVGADGQIVWVVGYRIDDRVKVTTHTRRFLWITTEPVPTPANTASSSA